MGLVFVKGDPTREETLRKANLSAASHVIVLVKNAADPHSDDHNLVTTLVIEKLNPGVFTLVEALSTEKIHQLELAGANSVICAAEIASGLIIQELSDPGIKDIVLDLTSDLGGCQLYFVPLSSMKTWQYGELVAWGARARATVIGIVREGKPKLNCEGTMPLVAGDSAVLLAGERHAAIDTSA
jgi:voltage-gated potassium channel